MKLTTVIVRLKKQMIKVAMGGGRKSYKLNSNVLAPVQKEKKLLFINYISTYMQKHLHENKCSYFK